MIGAGKRPTKKKTIVEEVVEKPKQSAAIFNDDDEADAMFGAGAAIDGKR